MNIGRMLATVLVVLVATTGTSSSAEAAEREVSVRKSVAFGLDWRGRPVPVPIRTASRRGYLIKSGASRLILGVGF